jgi:hypothetical protein
MIHMIQERFGQTLRSGTSAIPREFGIELRKNEVLSVPYDRNSAKV